MFIFPANTARHVYFISLLFLFFEQQTNAFYLLDLWNLHNSRLVEKSRVMPNENYFRKKQAFWLRLLYFL